MINNICVPKSIFFVLVGIFLTILFFYRNFFNNNIKISKNNKILKIKIKKKKKKNNRDKLIIRDRKVINDPIHPPERRVPRHIYPKEYVQSKTNVPTRGYPDNYQLLGILSRKKDEKVMQLFGRQLYPGATQYEYYIKGKDLSGMEAKFPLNIQNDKELYNNDKITVSQLDKKKGDFIVTLYELDGPKYNPYVL